jgi:hypothetical protein
VVAAESYTAIPIVNSSIYDKQSRKLVPTNPGVMNSWFDLFDNNIPKLSATVVPKSANVWRVPRSPQFFD